MPINIEIGRTDGFRYIGIQPPLSREQYAVVAQGLSKDDVNLGFKSRVPHSGDVYTEGSAMSSSDEHITLVAGKIANILRSTGEVVSVNVAIQQIGWGRHLFNGTDRDLVES